MRRAWVLAVMPLSMAMARTASMRLPASPSKAMPIGGRAAPRPVGCCMAGERLRQARRIEVSGRVAEVLHRHTHAIHQRQMEIRHRRFLAVHDAAARLEVVAAAAD